MPTTVNGIGTHYYGKRDPAVRLGTCQHCGHEGKLESYTTRLWFVILYLPIIPLKRVRLLDYCPYCSRHYAVNPEEYEKSRQEAVTKALREYTANPTIEAAIDVHAQMIIYHMNRELNTFQESALANFPHSAELRRTFAAHLDQFGRTNEATPLYEDAFSISPEMPDVRMALAARRIDAGKPEEAEPLLDFLMQPGTGRTHNLQLLEALAKSYQRIGDHDKTLEVCSVLIREIPKVVDHYAFRNLVQKSEKAIHRSPSLLPDRSFSLSEFFNSKSTAYSPNARWLWYTLIALVIVGGILAGTNNYFSNHRTLYVLNGFAQPVSLSINGGPAVEFGSSKSFDLPEGPHQIDITSPISKQANVILRSSYWSRWLYRPIWIFNIEQIENVYEETIHYAVVPQPTDAEELDDEEFVYVPHVDYAFVEPPKQMKVKGRNASITKVHVGVSPGSALSRFSDLMRSSNQNIASIYAEGFLNKDPNNVMLLSRYAMMAKGTPSAESASVFLKAGLWQTPIRISWHRAYQFLNSSEQATQDLLNEYEQKLKDDPKNPILVYLRGRVAKTRSERLEYFRRAREIDQASGWPSYGLAVDALNRGEWQEAKSYYDEAQNLIGSDPSLKRLKHHLHLAISDTDALEAEYRKGMEGNDSTEFTLSMMLFADLMATKGKCDEAKEYLQKRLNERFGPTFKDQMYEVFEPCLAYPCQDVDRLKLKDDQPVPSGFAKYFFDQLLVLGEMERALQVAESEKLLDTWNQPLQISLAYSLAGNQDEADRWRLKACELLETDGTDERRASELLKGDRAPTDNDLDEINLAISDTPLFLVALAQRFPNDKEQLDKRAERLSISRLPPYLFVKKLLEQR